MWNWTKNTNAVETKNEKSNIKEAFNLKDGNEGDQAYKIKENVNQHRAVLVKGKKDKKNCLKK